MSIRLATLLVFLAYFVAPTNVALACGSHAAKHAGLELTEKSCCTEKNKSASAACCGETDDCSAEHPGQNCPDTDGCGGCHCPGCGTVGFAPTVFTNADYLVPFLIPFDVRMLRPAFYFAQHLPEEVSLPIWQPPKIGA